MKIQLSNGEATIKDICTHKIKKGVTKIIAKDVTVNAEGKVSGIMADSLEDANDFALKEMIEKFTIDGKELEVTTEVLDNLSEVDYQLILTAINKVTESIIPKK